MWNWLTGVDPTTTSLPFLKDREFPAGVPIIWTTDEKDHEHPVKPWPSHLEYLRYYVKAAVSREIEDKFIFVDKTRQKLASTGLLLAWDWWCRTEQARRMLWSKLTQEQAADMLNEKVRAVDLRLPEWIRDLYGLSHTPYARLRYKLTRSLFMAVNEAAAHGAARGGTATAIGIDEAAYQDYLKQIIVASIPMAGKVFSLTTAAVGGPDSGAGFFLAQIKDGRIYKAATPIKPGAPRDASDNPYPDALVAIRGYRERLTPKTKYKVIEIDFTADPAKDNPEWLQEQYRLLGESMVRREVLRDWTVAEGDAFYPEYSNRGGRERYEFQLRGLLPAPIIVGWDLGMRHPVFLFLQISPTTKRVYVLRGCCILGAQGPLKTDVDTYTLADLFNIIVGKLSQEEALPSAQAIYLALLSEGSPPAPWFPKSAEFLHISGPEADTRSAHAKPDDPRTARDIFASKGITLEAPRVLIVDRVKVTRKLLLLGRDGKPGIFISDDPTVEEVHNMLNGGLSFPKGTLDNPTPVKPRKDGWYDDIHDALTYPIAELVPAEEQKPVNKRQVWGGPHSRELRVVSDEDEEYGSLNLYEGRSR